MNSTPNRVCEVPMCESTSITTPNKLFIPVPTGKLIRDDWARLARRNPTELGSCPKYFCEDHFDLPKDMINYMEYRVMGSVGQVRMVKGCVPTKFECQAGAVTDDDGIKYLTKTPVGKDAVKRRKRRRDNCKMVDIGVQTKISMETYKSSSSQTEDKYLDFQVTPFNSNLQATSSTNNGTDDKVNKMLARVFAYFARECSELSRVQLRQRTALCTGATQAAVQRALELTQDPTLRQPPNKRRRGRRKHTSPDPDTDANGDSNGALLLEIQPMEVVKKDDCKKPEISESCINVKIEPYDEPIHQNIDKPNQYLDTKPMTSQIKEEFPENNTFENTEVKIEIHEDGFT